MKSFIIDAQNEKYNSKLFNISFFQAINFCFCWWSNFKLNALRFSNNFLKVLSFVSMSNQSPSKIRALPLSFCAGVMISFLLIGFAMIFLKQAGLFLGWGFQIAVLQLL
jgi:hypothetical protein